MRVIVSGGGTGGHLYPALAIGRKFKDLGAEVLYIGSKYGIENDVIEGQGFEYYLLPVEGIRNKKFYQMPKGIYHLLTATRKAGKILKEFQPDLIIGTGGYASFPVLEAGLKTSAKTMIHEANAQMGKANLELAGKVDCLCLTYSDTAKSIPNAKRLLLTGMIMRESVKTATRSDGAAYLGVDEDKLIVTITGGSQGSRSINNAMLAYYEKYADNGKVLFYHIVGRKNGDQLEQLGKYPFVQGKLYEDKMDLVVARTDLCISRAGSSFLTEIAYKGVPAILVPYPFANGHQEKNAVYYESKGAAKLVPDKSLPKGLHLALDDILNDDKKRLTMSVKMRGEAKGDALDRIVETGLALIKNKGKTR